MNRKKIFQILIFGSILIFNAVTYIPPETSMSDILLAASVFIGIIYFAIRALKYFKIIKEFY
jgi:hypothetical protein